MPWQRHHAKERFSSALFAALLLVSAAATATAIWSVNYATSATATANAPARR
jgi:hypothetical protein